MISARQAIKHGIKCVYVDVSKNFISYTIFVDVNGANNTVTDTYSKRYHDKIFNPFRVKEMREFMKTATVENPLPNRFIFRRVTK